MKKIISMFLLLAILTVLPISAYAESSVKYVDDQAWILTEEEVSKLTALAEEASEEVGCGIYILTVPDFRELPEGYNYSVSTVLRFYYEAQGYGTGSNRDGVILMLSMAERDYSLYTCGFGDTGLSDPAMDYLTERFLRDFSQDSWYNGFAHYISCTEDLLQKTLDGDPYDEYTATSGEKFLGIVLCILASLLGSSLITNHFVRQMKSVELKRDAENFAGDLVLTHQNTRYTNTTTTRVYDPPSSSGSSGRSSGGGGGGSSRSGKF